MTVLSDVAEFGALELFDRRNPPGVTDPPIAVAGLRTALLFGIVALSGCGLEVDEMSNTETDGRPLECPLSSPNETLSGVGRCFLERWRPCRLVRNGDEALEVDFTYDLEGRLVAEEASEEAGDVRRYYHQGSLLRRVDASGDSSFVEDYDYEGIRLRSVLRVSDESVRRTLEYDGEGRLAEVRWDEIEPRQRGFFWSGDRVTSVEQTVWRAPDVRLPRRDDVFREELVYDDHRRLAVRERWVPFDPTEIFTATYSYDVQGRLDAVRYERGLSDVEEVSYRWDDRDRLMAVRHMTEPPVVTELHYWCR